MTSTDGALSPEVRAVVDEFQAMVSVDGARIDVLRSDPSRLELDLVLVEAGCAECVMPRDYLEAIIRDQLQTALDAPPEVTIRDPRELTDTPKAD
ncbi:hypothetical protein [Nocardioides halotolerans]|uniref:hypothetical protein n=1 Tax=Nocardioides halotolerans TaxID=433660 RepID=UPI00048EB610|nr:hypothetical protein [Nocardioides halotolerans]